MATNTPNYGLVKPAQNDFYNVDDFNGNADIVDTAMKSNADLAAAVQDNLKVHIDDKGNPHGATKTQIGLGSVDNTSDANKPISTATQTALDAVNDTVDGLQIGGANILRNTNKDISLTSTGVWSNGTWRSASAGTGARTPVAITDAPNPDISRGWELTSTSTYIDVAQDSTPVVVGQSYILSCFARLISGTAKVHLQIGKTTYLTTATDITSTEWQKFSFRVTPVSGNVSGGATNVYLGVWAASGVAGTIQICGMKLELGNRATDWSPSPWDVDTAVAANTTTIASVQTAIDSLVGKIYPVGSIYMSTAATNPSSFLGGTWVAWGAGRVPVGVDTGDTDFSAANKTGGAKTHSLTVSEMPAHTHYIGGYLWGSETYTVASGSALNVPGRSYNTNPPTESAGGGGAHNNLQPYVTCYMWRRTA